MTPEEQEAVRRALAATPPVGPMPPEVVARLEATITELAAVRSTPPTPPTPAEVADLEERRRRRWPKVLVAAASVAVLAYGVGAVLQDTGPQADTAMTEAGAGAAEESLREGGTDDEGAAEGAVPQAVEPELHEAPALLAEGPVVRLREETLRRDVVRHLRQQRSSPAAGAALDELDTRRGGTCLLPEVGRGDTVLAARLDGRRATLVVRRAEAGSRVAQVYWCGDGRTLLAETEIPAHR